MSRWFVYLKPTESLCRDPWIDQDWRVKNSNVVGMNVLFDSLMKCHPMKDARKDFLHNSPLSFQLICVNVNSASKFQAGAKS
jgi:hypothetical protein